MWPFKDKEIEEYKEFIELIKENSDLNIEINKLYIALHKCGNELYKHTGNGDHMTTEYWIKEKI